MTLLPISLRPHVADASIERFAAFLVIGLLFALAYPRHLLMVLFMVVASAAALEALQLIDPKRHARWLDLAVKGAGALTGVAIGAGAPRKPGEGR